MYQNIINAVLNTLFVSVPETLVWLIFVLIMLKEKNLLDVYFWKENLRKFMVVCFPISVLTNIMRYILHVDNLVNFITIEVMMCGLVIYLIKKNNFLNEKINYLKIVLYVILADFIIIFLTEGSYAITISLLLNKSILEINNNILLNILLSLVPRLIQILLIIVYFHKKNFEEKISYIEIIFKNRILTISTLVFLTTVLSVLFISTRLLAETQILQNYRPIIQVISSISVLLIPSTLIASYIISICNLINQNIKLRQEKENIYDNIM